MSLEGGRQVEGVAVAEHVVDDVSVVIMQLYGIGSVLDECSSEGCFEPLGALAKDHSMRLHSRRPTLDGNVGKGAGIIEPIAHYAELVECRFGKVCCCDMV